MRRWLAVVLGVLAVTLAATACGSDAAIDNTGGTTVSKDVNVGGSGPVALQLGQEMIVTLESNPTTGYDWLIDTAPDTAVVESIGEPSYQPTPVASDIVGSGGNTSLRFSATGVGTTTVVLRYKRAWEDDTPDDRLVTLDITVTDG